MAGNNEDRIGLLFWEMTLDDSEFKTKISDSKKGLKKLDKEGGSSLGALAKKMAVAGVAAAGLAGGLLALAVNGAKGAAESKILADSIGATTAEMEGLKIASEKMGVEQNMLIDKMREFGGITEFKKLADDVKNAGGPVDQLNKSIELFGNEGAKILPILQQGSEGLKAFEDQAEATGLALSPEDTERAAEAWDAYTDLTLEAKGAARELGVAISGIIPALTRMVGGIREGVTAIGEIASGFTIWRNELLGIQDPTSKAATSEEILAAKANNAAKALERQRDATNGLNTATEKTFAQDIFGAALQKEKLNDLRESIGLSEKGFAKVSGSIASALDRGEDMAQIKDDLKVLMGSDLSPFGDDDFNISNLPESLKKAAKKGEEDTKKILKEVESQTADERRFAGMATAGSLAEYKILSGQDSAAKDTAKNTKRTNQILEKLGTV